MKYIQLTQGKQAIVDDEDYEYLNQFKWYADKKYATRKVSLAEGRDKQVRVRQYLHRAVLRDAPKNQRIDHINGNTFDNRKSNLRPCTPAQNAVNSNMRANNTTGYRGVNWNERDKKWRVIVQKRFVGNYKDIKEAAQAYNKVAVDMYGEFARLNDVE